MKYLETCIAARPEACALARPKATINSLTNAIHSLTEQVKVEPILIGDNITSQPVSPDEI